MEIFLALKNGQFEPLLLSLKKNRLTSDTLDLINHYVNCTQEGSQNAPHTYNELLLKVQMELEREQEGIETIKPIIELYQSHLTGPLTALCLRSLNRAGEQAKHGKFYKSTQQSCPTCSFPDWNTMDFTFKKLKDLNDDISLEAIDPASRFQAKTFREYAERITHHSSSFVYHFKSYLLNRIGYDTNPMN
jgi:hypothetical protein